MQPTQLWGRKVVLGPQQDNGALGPSGAAQVCHSGITRGGGWVVPAGSMAGAVTGATLRGLRAVDIHKEAKVEELD